jgi:cellulose synthase/poly-beta-1,6-N-acetylglucosamine synthase-like glycosyltransferase
MSLLLSFVAVLLAAQVGYLLVLSLLARRASLRPDRRPPEASELPRMLVLLPAYREDAVVEASAHAVLASAYPQERLRLVVIADGLQPDTLARLRALPLDVLPVAFERSTKARALREALRHYPSVDYEAVAILDADNQPERFALAHLGRAVREGATVVQGQRVAKNLDTAYAHLDAWSEAINNRWFRAGVQAGGGSPALIGSGMAFRYACFAEWMQAIDAVSGFDKQLELHFLRRGYRALYLPEAIVRDEKVARGDHFTRQRSRWLAAQWRFGLPLLPAALAGLFQGRVGYCHKVVQHLLLPRPFLAWALASTSLVMALHWGAAGLLPGGVLLSAFVLAVALVLPRDAYRHKQGWTALPAACGRLWLSLWGMTRARRQFLHTPHGKCP